MRRDWKQYFQTHPMAMLGVAAGGGILLATISRGRKNRRRERSFSSGDAGPEPDAGNVHGKYKPPGTWDNIKGALMAVAAARFKDFVGEVAPGLSRVVLRSEDKVRALPPPAPG